MKSLFSITLFSVLLLAFPFALIAQDMLKISGKVVDEETSEPLTHASIGVIGKPYGTITNTDGYFELYISENQLEDSLQVSMLGYENYEIKFGSFNTSVRTIKLIIKPVVLKEITVTTNEMTALQILTKAFEKIEDNNPIQSYRLTAYKRELYSDNGQTSYLNDAVIHIYDKGYKQVRRPDRNKINEKVEIKQVRASKNYSHKVFRGHNGQNGGFSYLKYALRTNILKYRKREVLNNFFIASYAIDSLVYLDNQLFYIINVTLIKDHVQFSDTYFVNTDNYSIKKHVYKEVADQGFKRNQWQFQNDSSYWYQNYTLLHDSEYQNFQGKMYLKFMRGRYTAGIYNSETKSVESKLATDDLLLVTEVDTANTKFNTKDIIRSNNPLTFYLQKYNVSFWNNYETANMLPLTKKQIADLEREIPLEGQFKLSGLNAHEY